MLQTLRKHHPINALRLCSLKNEHKNKKLMDSSTDTDKYQINNSNPKNQIYEAGIYKKIYSKYFFISLG